jgi:hypothetical protein
MNTITLSARRQAGRTPAGPQTMMNHPAAPSWKANLAEALTIYRGRLCRELLDLLASIVPSASAVIDIASVIDVEDVDLFAVFVDGVADPVFAAPCTPVPFERGSQRGANSVWFFGQRAADELVTGPRGSLRQPLLELPGSRGRDHDVVGHGSALAEPLR